MPTPTQLLTRLDELGRALASTERALGLIGLGSVGLERGRLDNYSDLDFFVIARPGHKQFFLDDLSWFNAPCPLVFAFLNTADGYKALFADGIFCEMAVFEPDELANIPFAAGQIIWQADDAPADMGSPRVPLPRSSHTAEWHLNEALTNLYVGLGRYWRGEKLTAMRFIQVYALDRVLALAATLEPAQQAFPDPFSPDRRCEQRLPQASQLLPLFAQGYEQTPASAVAILNYLEQHFEVNPHLGRAIRQLAQPPLS